MVNLLGLGTSAACAVLLMPLGMRVGSTVAKEFAGPQTIHAKPTSRLGGAIVVVAYMAAVLVVLTFEHESRRSALPLLLSALPVVCVGLCEDVTHRIGPWPRLAAALLSAALASEFAGGVLLRVDVPFIDLAFAFVPFALLATWIMVAGLCNAVNLIDGAHGLAGGTALIMFVGLAIVADAVGDRFVFAQALGMAGALAGFLLWNYPAGRIFLGDAGAYFVGFMYAELGILLVARNHAVSAWFPLALAAYPVIETIYTIYRRRVLGRTASMQPDALHLHSLIFRHLAGKSAHPTTKLTANASVAPWLWLHVAACLFAATLVYDNAAALALLTLVCARYYTFWYHRLLRSEAPRLDSTPAVAAGD